jgi:hypothetical protein
LLVSLLVFNFLCLMLQCLYHIQLDAIYITNWEANLFIISF